jgi:hypothetical protein
MENKQLKDELNTQKRYISNFDQIISEKNDQIERAKNEISVLTKTLNEKSNTIIEVILKF